MLLKLGEMGDMNNLWEGLDISTCQGILYSFPLDIE